MASQKTSITDIISLIFVIGRSMREGIHKRAGGGEFGSFLQFETLRYVKDHKRPLMRDVADYFMITPPAATLLIDGLVREKLLGRAFDERDRRAVRVALTPSGQKFLARGMKVRLAHLKKIFSVLSADERAELTNILRKISKTRKI